MNYRLWNLHNRLRQVLPTSPHCQFDEKKNYFKVLKPKIDEIFEAEFDLILVSRKLEAAMTPMGMNYHFFNYLAPIYGEYFQKLKHFEKVLKGSLPEIREYYSVFEFPSSEYVYEIMKNDFDILKPQVENELNEARNRNPKWTEWEDLDIRWNEVNELYKKATKPKEKK